MSVEVKVMTIPGAPLEGLDPLPRFHSHRSERCQTAEDFPEKMKEGLGTRQRVLPYRAQDRYSRKRLPLKKKTIVLENEYLKAVFWPEDGGKLYSLFDKVTGRELLMCNPVYQPGNLAIRNAWLSGGIEWNFGNLGHNCFTCDNLFAAVLKDTEGNEFVRVYEFERMKRTLFQIDFHLPAGSLLLYSHVKVFNPFDRDTTTYWWTNIAIPEDGNTRVLSSEDMVIFYGGGNLTYEKLPYLTAFGDADLTYAHNATRGFDYFFQAPEGKLTTWEAGAQGDGLVFFDRSTAPLLYKKMFCWGNHSAGDHWQDFLSEPGMGRYIELQSGFARSQMHDKMFPAKSTMEWTQCFGGAMLNAESLHQENWSDANAYLGEYLDTVISQEKLLRRNEEFSRLAKMEVHEEDLVHLGSGWGALEELRIAAYETGCEFPKSVCFPRSTIGKEQYPWYALLTEGKLPEESPEVIPPSWMVSRKWMELLEKSLREDGESWYSMLHYGVMLMEQMDEEHFAAEGSQWPEYPEYTRRAREAFRRSVELEPSVWALRCLFCLEHTEGNDDLAESYYDEVFRMDAATVDYAFAAEYMRFLNSRGKYEKAWELYSSLPEKIQQVDRMMICAAQTAIKLRKLDFLSKFFEREYADIAEGETSLTDLWFEYCARKMAKERGLGEDVQGETLEKLMDEAWASCPPPAAIDFRMSFDRQKKYRMEQ